MPVYRSLESKIVEQSRFISSTQTQGLESMGLESAPVSGIGNFRPFKPVDFGKPLSVVIRKIYTGRFPEHHLFSSRKPMLISSAIKDIATTSAATRALNVLKKAVDPQSEFSGPAAAEEGTALIYYSPALASPFLTIGVTMIFEDFDKELFDRASTLFGSLAGVPIFAPAMGYLLGASTVVKLAGGVGDQIFNGYPALDENFQLDFSFGGGSIPTEGFFILSSAALDTSKYQFDPNRGLIEKSNSRPYSGLDPVIIVSVDGEAVDGIANFTPLLASASVLGRFFNQRDGSEVALDTALDAIKLLNDLKYRKKAEETKAKLAALPQDSVDRQKLQDALNTFNANIGEDRLRLANS
jgi:hypothetical protein